MSDDRGKVYDGISCLTAPHADFYDSSVMQQTAPGPHLTEEQNAVHQVVTSFAAAFKYYALYPEGHAFSRNYLARFKSDLDEFLLGQKALRLEIVKNTFFYQGEPAAVGGADENNPAYLLSRDRILSLEFARNVELNEITLLLDILKRHRNPLDDTDDDIATTLWHNPFTHIHYEAADIFAMEAIEFDLSMFRAGPGQDRTGGGGDGDGVADQPASAGQGDSRRPAGGRRLPVNASDGSGRYSPPGGDAAEAPSSIMLLAANRNLAELAPEEQKLLAFQVRQAEEHDYSSDAIDILLITLASETNEIDFAGILEFLESEFLDAMAREDFSLAHKIVRNVMNIFVAIKTKKNWTITLVNLFFASLSREDRYAEMPWLVESWRLAADHRKILELLNTLDTLSAEIIPVLGSLAVQVPVDNLDLRYTFVDRIAAKAKNNPEPLCRLIAESGEETNLLLLLVAEQLADEGAARVYLEMSRHPSPLIRKAGMDGFFRTSRAPRTDQMLHLLADHDGQVRERMLSYLKQLDLPSREDLLTAFLDRDSGSVDDELYIMHCYRLLSGCLTSRSIEFLRKTLLESDLKSQFSQIRKAHRSGAAYVLKSFGSKETLEILRQGAESMWPDVRQICRKALKL